MCKLTVSEKCNERVKIGITAANAAAARQEDVNVAYVNGRFCTFVSRATGNALVTVVRKSRLLKGRLIAEREALRVAVK